MTPNLLFGTYASASVNTSIQQSDVNTFNQQSDAVFASSNLSGDQLEFDESLYYSSPLQARSRLITLFKKAIKNVKWGTVLDTFCKISDTVTNIISTFKDKDTGNELNPKYNLVGYGYQTVGGNVKQVQKLLKEHNYSVAVDGIWGPKTCDAVKKFQRAKGLKDDGIVGYNTWKALYN